MSDWRAGESRYESARRIIEKVAADNPGVSEKELLRLIRDAYPWGERRMHPYKAWLRARRDYIDSRDSRAAWAEAASPEGGEA